MTCQSCSYRNKEPDPTSSSHPSPEVSSVFEQARKIEDAIKCLQEERALLLQMHNHMKDPTEVLPDEILSAIFQLVHPVVATKENMSTALEVDSYNQSLSVIQNLSRIRLGAVSSRWRRVAWSIPYLWTSLTLEVKYWNVKECVSLIGLFFENVGGLSLSLELDFRRRQIIDRSTQREFEPRTRASLDPLRDTLFSTYLGKLKDLRLIVPPPEWLHLVSTKATALEALSFSWPRLSGRVVEEPSDPFKLALENIPHLQRFSICCLNYDVPFKLNWEVITDLTLEGAGYDKCLLLLCLCKNVRSFRSRAPRGCRRKMESYTLSSCLHLEHFEWTISGYETSAPHTLRMLRRLELPSESLRTLVLSGDSGVLYVIVQGGGAASMNFFSRLPTTLESFSLISRWHPHDVTQASPYIESCLRSIPSLKYLNLEDTYGVYINSLFNILYPSHNPDLLPNLCSVKVKQRPACRRYDSDNLPPDFDLIMDAFNERNSSRSNPRFSVEVEGGICLGWDSRIRDKLNIVAENGHEVETRMETTYSDSIIYWSVKFS